MAFVVGIRLASFAAAGVALIMTHEAAQGAKEKLWQWVVDKFTSRSSGPAPQPAKPCDAGWKAVNEGGAFVNGGTPAGTQEPTLYPVKATENAGTADLMSEGDNAVNGMRPVHIEEPTLAAANVTENAVDRDPTVEQSTPNQDNAINVPVPGDFPSHLDTDAESDNAVNGDLTAEPLQRHGVNATREAPTIVAVDAIGLQAAGVHRTVDDVDNAVGVGETRAMDKSCQMDSDELAQGAPDPDPPPGGGNRGSFVAAAVNAVKNWARSLFNSLTANIGDVSDPKVRDLMRRILKRAGFLAMEMVILEPVLRRYKGWRKFYNIVKNELWTGCCW